MKSNLLKEFIEKGQTNLESGDNKLAIANFLKALKLNPKNPSICLKIAYVYYVDRDCDKAEEYNKKALELDLSIPHKIQAYNQLINNAMAQRNFVKALEYARNDIFEQDQKAKSALYPTLARAYLNLANKEKLRECLQKSLQIIEKEHPTDVYFLSMTYKMLGEYKLYFELEFEEAAKAYGKILEVPNSGYTSDANIGLGKCHILLGKYADGIKFLNKATELIKINRIPNANLILTAVNKQLGKAYSSLGKYDKAIQSFNKMPILKPDFKNDIHSLPELENVLAYFYGLGLSNMREGESQKGIKYFNQGLDFISQFETPLFNKRMISDMFEMLINYELAKFYYEKKQMDKAKKAINKAYKITQELTPSSAPTLYIFIEKMQWPKDGTSIFKKIPLLRKKILL